jgi:hypothetical protein
MKKIVAPVVAVVLALGFTACSSADDADVVSENISKAADNFEINRRVVMFNGITDEYLLTIEGLCNIEDDGNQLEVTCLTKDAKDDDDKQYKKHFLGLSDNVSYFVEQGESVNVSANHYRVTFKPQSIVPDVDFRGSTEDLPESQK